MTLDSDYPCPLPHQHSERSYHHSSFVSAAKAQVHEQSEKMVCRHVQKCSRNKVYHNVVYLPEEHWGGGHYLTPWNVPYKEVTYKVLTSSVVAISPRQHPTSTRLNGQLSPFDVCINETHNFNITMFGVNTSPSLFRIQPAHNEYIINIHVHVLLYKSRFLSLILTHILTIPFSLQVLTQTFRCNYCVRTTST